MAVTLVDTDVLIDCRRGLPAATTWARSLRGFEVAVPGMVAMELIVGCLNTPDLRGARRLLDLFDVCWPGEAETALAYDLLRRHHLRHGLGIADCFIAAAALHREATLLTFNARHFRAVQGLRFEAPYDRSVS